MKFTNENNIFFSVIITVYNDEKFILETLISLQNQVYCDFEVIIIDDCSTDRSFLLISEFIKDKNNWYLYKNNINHGVAYSRDKGFKFAKGQYITILDSDDIWKPEKLLLQHYYLEYNKVDICYTAYGFINETSKEYGRLYYVKENADYVSLLKQNYIGCSTVAFARKIVNEYSMNTGYAHEDYALWLKLIKKGYTAKGINQCLVLYRIRRDSRSSNKILATKNRFVIYRKQENLSFMVSCYYLLCYVIGGIRKNLGTKNLANRTAYNKVLGD